MFYKVSLVHTESTSESVNLKVATLSFECTRSKFGFDFFYPKKKKKDRNDFSAPITHSIVKCICFPDNLQMEHFATA